MALHDMPQNAVIALGSYEKCRLMREHAGAHCGRQTLMLVNVLFSRMLPPALIRMPLESCPVCALHQRDHHNLLILYYLRVSFLQ